MKRMLWTLALTFLAAFGSGSWYGHHQAVVFRAARWELQLAENAANARLDRPIRLAGQQVTLAQLRDLIATATGLEVTIDEEEIERVQGEYLRGSRLSPHTVRELSFRLPIGEFTVRRALDHVFLPSYLDYELHGSALVFSTQDAIADHVQTVVYSLPEPMLAQTTEDDWVILISECIDVSAWHGTGGRGHIEAVPGALVVVQTPAIQRKVRRIIDQLSSIELPPESHESRLLLPPCDPGSRGKLLAALAQPASVAAVDQSLRDVVAQLAEQHGLPLAIDVARLEEAAISIDQPVTLHLDNVTLRCVLNHLLNDLELGIRDNGDSLVVTTPEEAEEELHVVAYPLHDLVWTDGFVDYDSLIELITTNVAPQLWGEGNTFVPTLGTGWLVVPQTREVHEQFESLLTGLRTALPGDGRAMVSLRGEMSPATQRIEAALRRSLALDFDQVPLREIAGQLARELGINVLLDTRSLLEAGVMFDPPITWRAPALPLASQLTWMLRDLDLMWIVQDEALVITSTAEVAGHPITRIYDVRGLTDPDLGIVGMHELPAVIERLVAPGTWTSSRGIGSLTEFQGLLVVSQTAEVHDELERFLAALETHCRRAAPPSDSGPRQVRLDPSPSAERIERLLEANISVNYCGVPLRELLRDLASRLDLPAAFDLPAVAAEGYDFEELVSISAHERPLVEVLDELFAPREFTYEVRGDVLLFSFKNRRDPALHTRLYQVSDLLSAADPASLPKLAERLTSIDVGYWDGMQGGPGITLPMGRDWLAISADWRKHQVVDDWLTLRRTGKSPPRAIQRAAALEVQLRLEQARHLMQTGKDPFAIP